MGLVRTRGATLERRMVFLHTIKLKSEKKRQKSSAKVLGLELETHGGWRPRGTEQFGDSRQLRDPEKHMLEHLQGQLVVQLLRGETRRITDSSILVAKMSAQLQRLNAPPQP